ncbi:MAG: hypothetical protein EAZ35_09025 [Sphingobacteriia bacterium]|nr:MAG: hypothetical protein EAZ35_09025 [Sphingobacteriia bacterium]
MKKIKIASLFLMLIVAACSKKDDTLANNSKTPMELITNGKWYRSAYTSSIPIDWNGNGVLITNLFGAMEACEKDNYLVFKSNLEIIFNEGATKCRSSDPQEETETWKFQNNDKEIVIGGGDPYTIVELTATSLVVKDKNPSVYNGVSYHVTESFRH